MANNEELIKTIATTVGNQVKTMVEASLKKEAEYYNANKQLRDETLKYLQALNNRIDVYEELIEDSKNTATRMATERAKNEAVLKEIDEKTANANKALDLLKLAGSIELEQYAAEAELENREKLIREEIKAERAALSDRFDARREALQAGRGQYYPELEKQLEELAETLSKQQEETLPKKATRKPQAKNAPLPKPTKTQEEQALPDITGA